MYSYEITFDRIVDIKNDTRVKEMMTFKCEYPCHLFPCMDIVSRLPKNIIVDLQTVEVKVIEEIKRPKKRK